MNIYGTTELWITEYSIKRFKNLTRFYIQIVIGLEYVMIERAIVDMRLILGQVQ